MLGQDKVCIKQEGSKIISAKHSEYVIYFDSEDEALEYTAKNVHFNQNGMTESATTCVNSSLVDTEVVHPK
jgi:hypothetical protein